MAKLKGTIGKRPGWESRLRPGCVDAMPNRKAALRLARRTAHWKKAVDNWDRNRKDRITSGAAKSKPGSWK